MEARYCYGFVEDAPSREVAIKLLEYRNLSSSRPIRFIPGFPSDLRGSGNLKKKCSALLEMSKHASVLCLTDLDTWPCAPSLISSWFSSSPEGSPGLPKGLCFRIAVREIESWIMADRHAWASYIGIAAANFPAHPDDLPDPKQYLLNVIRAKGKKKMHADMLPRGSGHVGPLYNDILCRFIQSTWSANRASRFSPSLMRAINALHRI